jgi:hypothetical protein
MASILTKKNIEKLLKARQLYDDCRQAKEKAHADESHGVKLQQMLSEAIQVRDQGLSKLGITSLEEFKKFNAEMNIAEIKAYMPALTYCDNCKGYDGVPPCSVTCGEMSLYNTWKGTQEDIDKFWIFIYQLVKKIPYNDERNALSGEALPENVSKLARLNTGKKASKDEARQWSICPPGHGFTFDYKRDPQFDITWVVNVHTDT